MLFLLEQKGTGQRMGLLLVTAMRKQGYCRSEMVKIRWSKQKAIHEIKLQGEDFVLYWRGCCWSMKEMGRTVHLLLVSL